MMPDDASDDYGQRPAANHQTADPDDENHLRLLSIFHYICGGICVLFGCFPILHLTIGLAMLGAAAPGFPEGQQRPETAIAGTLFIVIATVLITMFWALAGAIIYCGRMLATRRGYTYCMVVAGIECFWMPFGTALGVFTLIVLMRPSVKALFDRSRRVA